MESKSITAESPATREQEIISLYYHIKLDVYEIKLKYNCSEKYIASVLANNNIQTKDDCFIVESIINYVKHLV